MSRKTIFLMGAPSGRLQWDDKDLLKVPVPPFTRSSTTIPSTSTSSRVDSTNWRVLQSATTAKLYGPQWTQHTLFLDTANLPAKLPRISDDVLLSQFYELSLSILGTSFPSESDNNDTTMPLSEEDSDINQSTGSEVADNTEAVPFPYPRELHDIKDIPNAAYLRSIIPQTPSVTLVVAVIGINPIRRVTARQSKQELDILELIVGDETRTGFGVTFWLPVLDEYNHGRQGNSSADFREKILGIRLRDVVLMRNVGLGSFQDLVYGQSLWRGMTKVDLLHRQQIDSQDIQGAYSTVAIDTATREDRLLCKVRNVRDWLMNFVGTKAPGRTVGQPLPPDTQ